MQGVLAVNLVLFSLQKSFMKWPGSFSEWRMSVYGLFYWAIARFLLETRHFSFVCSFLQHSLFSTGFIQLPKANLFQWKPEVWKSHMYFFCSSIHLWIKVYRSTWKITLPLSTGEFCQTKLLPWKLSKRGGSTQQKPCN